MGLFSKVRAEVEHYKETPVKTEYGWVTSRKEFLQLRAAAQAAAQAKKKR